MFRSPNVLRVQVASLTLAPRKLGWLARAEIRAWETTRQENEKGQELCQPITNTSSARMCCLCEAAMMAIGENEKGVGRAHSCEARRAD
jgi:hypothetical protein